MRSEHDSRENHEGGKRPNTRNWWRQLSQAAGYRAKLITFEVGSRGMVMDDDVHQKH